MNKKQTGHSQDSARHPPRLIHSAWYAGSSGSGLDFPVSCVCEKSHLNVDDRVSAATPHLPVSSSVSLPPSFFPLLACLNLAETAVKSKIFDGP